MWRVDPHTADVRIRVAAPTLRQLFTDALRGLTAVMEPDVAAGRHDVAFGVALEAADTTLLLIDFLNAALTASTIQRCAFTNAEFRILEPARLDATLIGPRVRGFAEDVKSVTYHEASVARIGEEWTVTLVLDI